MLMYNKTVAAVPFPVNRVEFWLNVLTVEGAAVRVFLVLQPFHAAERTLLCAPTESGLAPPRHSTLSNINDVCPTCSQAFNLHLEEDMLN